MNVGIVGLGGLGHMGVKLAKAMGANVTVLSRSMAKKAEARRLGPQFWRIPMRKPSKLQLGRLMSLSTRFPLTMILVICFRFSK